MVFKAVPKVFSTAASTAALGFFVFLGSQGNAQSKAPVSQSKTAQPPAGTPSSENASTQLAGLLNEIWQYRLSHDPEFASYVGDPRYNDRLDDYSVEGIHDCLAHELGFLERLLAMESSGLSDQERLSRDLQVRDLTQHQEEARYKEWEMPVNQESGFHTGLASLQQSLAFATVKDYDDYIARMKQVPRVFSQNTANMERGVEDGLIPPKYLLEKVLVQVKEIAAQKPEDSPFALPLKHFPASIPLATQKHIADDLLAVIQSDVLPSYQRFARFLEVSYVSHGRSDPGIWAIPGGDEYYAYCIRRETTTSLTADQIHQTGLQQVEQDQAQMLALAHSLGFADLKAVAAGIKANPKLHLQDRDQVMALYKGYLDQMRPKLPALFGRLPKAPLALRFVPAYMEKTQPPAYYDPGTADGKRPGYVNVNGYDLAHRTQEMSETIAYHEGIPGHHLQISIAEELPGQPEFRKYEGYTAYTEGWGLYSERLGKEVGFYKDQWSEYGRLEADMWRSVRLVVDTGVHSKHWTRDQMVEYFRDHTTMDDVAIQTEIDRYIAWPAQALAYKTGQLKILELRAYAEHELGGSFDIKQFHDQVLGSGALPLDVLEQRIHTWVTMKKSGTTTQPAIAAE